MLPILRVVIGAIAVLMLLGGLVLVATGNVAGLSGLWLVAMGAVGLIAVALERMRYRSEAAERSGEAPGAGGADDGPLDGRFQPTNERFLDPTTRRQLRVWVDPASGERRYRPDA